MQWCGGGAWIASYDADTPRHYIALQWLIRLHCTALCDYITLHCKFELHYRVVRCIIRAPYTALHYTVMHCIVTAHCTALSYYITLHCLTTLHCSSQCIFSSVNCTALHCHYRLLHYLDILDNTVTTICCCQLRDLNIILFENPNYFWLNKILPGLTSHSCTNFGKTHKEIIPC